MDSRHLEQRSSTLCMRSVAIAILAGVGMMMLLANFFYTWIGRQYNKDGLLFWVRLLIYGIIVAEPFLITIWTTLSQDRWRQRLALFSCAGLALLASWYLGFSFFDMSVSKSYWPQFEDARWTFAALSPLFVFCASIPLLIWRYGFGRTLRRPQMPATKQRQTVSVSGLMTITALTGVCLGLAHQAINWTGNDMRFDYKQVMTACLLAAAAQGLLVIPAIAGILSRTRFIAIVVSWVIAASGITVALWTTWRWYQQNREYSLPILPDIETSAVVSLTACLIMVAFLSALNLLGVRLDSDKPKKRLN